MFEAAEKVRAEIDALPDEAEASHPRRAALQAAAGAITHEVRRIEARRRELDAMVGVVRVSLSRPARLPRRAVRRRDRRGRVVRGRRVRAARSRGDPSRADDDVDAPVRGARP